MSKEGSLDAPTRHPIDFEHPDFFATSTSLTEFEEFLLPITKNMSHFEAIFLTAACLLVVA